MRPLETRPSFNKSATVRPQAADAPFDARATTATLKAMTPALPKRVRWAWRSERDGSLRAAV